MRISQRSVLLVLSLFSILAGRASAGLVTSYAIFGQQGVNMSGSTVNGVIASNGDIQVNPFSKFGGLTGGGSLIANTLGGLTISGGLTFNGSVTTGQYSTINGPINSGSNVDIGVGSTTTGAITAAGNVIEQQSASTTGNITAGGSVTNSVFGVVTGNVAANGSVTVGGTVKGNVTYGPGGTVTSPDHVTGSISQATTVVRPQVYTPTQISPIYTYAAGGTTITEANSGTATNPLAPGTYGALNVGTFGQVYLTAGDYYFTTFNFNGDTIHYLNVSATSHINIFVTGDVFENTFTAASVNGQTYAQSDASLAADITTETLGNFTAMGAGSHFGLVYAPTGNVTMGGFENLTGQIIAGGTVTAQSGGLTQNFVATNAIPVPEPRSILLTVLGIAVVFGPTRRLRSVSSPMLF